MPAWDWTRSDYKQMTTLRAQDLKWSVIAARMGRSGGTLRVMFSRYRRGQVKAVPSIADRVVEAFEANPRPVLVIATALGLSPRQVRNRVYRRGYDAEVRNELSPPNAQKNTVLNRRPAGASQKPQDGHSRRRGTTPSASLRGCQSAP